jgi:hypothetical protein
MKTKGMDEKRLKGPVIGDQQKGSAGMQADNHNL